MKKMKFYDYGAFFFSMVNISQYETFDAFQEFFFLGSWHGKNDIDNKMIVQKTGWIIKAVSK